MLDINIKHLYGHSKTPSKEYMYDAGLDLYSAEDVVLLPGRTKIIGLGVAVKIPSGWCALLVDRSSLGSKGIPRFGGLIDATYRGEWKVVLHNTTEVEYVINVGDKLVQAIFLPVPVLRIEKVDDLDKTERGDKGFGSSGK